MLRIRKAVITAAGPNQERLPLQRFVDVDGSEKTALQIVVEEVLSAGVEEICVVVRGGSQDTYRDAAGEHARSLVFVEQPAPRGYGEALHRAARFVGDEPFVHLVSDHLYVSRQPRRCAEQLVRAAREEQCAVSAVQPTRESMLQYYGAVGGSPVAGKSGYYQIERVLEKPTPTTAEQHLIVPGLRAGHYLCLFGMHVLTPAVMDLLGQMIADARSDGGPIMLSPALAQLAQRERYLALDLDGTRYNIGVKYGMFVAQLALALSGRDREEILAKLVELLAAAYQALGFQTLADQVRRSVRAVRGNQWMFRIGHPADHPLQLRSELKERAGPASPFPILVERTPVRMDLSHSGWSDIFFLGMDFPEGARVLNVSVDLGVRGRDPQPRPPIEVYLRVIDQPVLRLVSVDLRCKADVTTLGEVFDFAKDYLGLLKAAVIAAGIVPPGLEGSGQQLADVLTRLIGPGLGLEIVSQVNDIPKGSRLAVSTNLLAAIITACMRATSQIASLSGPLSEAERKLVAARAILGEWLGGSGGGWQDSGGIWPGMKMIEGQVAGAGDPEFGVSRGRLLPDHHIYSLSEVSRLTRQQICDSFILVHGGMAQNVGPILEMVTEKYLLRSAAEWEARQQAMAVMRSIEAALRSGDVRAIARATTENFCGPIQTIIPWASNHYTETLIDQVRRKFGPAYWGFLMLGGISGGGMGFIVDPARKAEAQDYLQDLMRATKRRLHSALPFAMEPVVYDFAINDAGTAAARWQGKDALMPPGYYAICANQWLRQDVQQLSPAVRNEIAQFAAACRTHPRLAGSTDLVLGALFPQPTEEQVDQPNLHQILAENDFDPELHEQIRADLRAGRIGLAQNRLPASTIVEDVDQQDVIDWLSGRAAEAEDRRCGTESLAGGEVAALALAGGAGTRWTQGAGVVKALHPFCRFQGKYRNFIEVHLAKARRVAAVFGAELPYIISTSYLTHEPIARFLQQRGDDSAAGPVLLSPGRSVGLRMVPMPRDLRFAWEEMPQQILDVQAQKVRESLHASLIGWAQSAGGGSDYTDNLPLQCLHPTGHWFEVPNLLRNGMLAKLLAERPQLKYLMLHNVDTLGADVDPGLLGLHIRRGACLTFEVIPRRIEDRGGGLARIGGRVRLVEGLAMPRKEDEFRLSYYNSMTTWITIGRLLEAFGLARSDLADEPKVTAAIRRFSHRLPTYITLKDVKKRWGHGQEDIFPVAQFEKLWGDMTSLAEVPCQFVAVPRLRGQQLKEQAQLDIWVRDGSAAYVDSLCAWQ